jgi:hypothetical protein
MLLPKIEPDYAGIRREVHEITKCDHKETALRRKVSSSGIATAWHQCTNCGVKVGKQTPKAKLGDSLQSLPLWDMDLEMQFYRSREELHRQTVEQQELQARQEWDRLYEEYLTTPEWQERKRLVMERACGLCEGCRRNAATDVHHLTYAHAGDEFLFELVAVCRGCHERLHDRQKKLTA